MMASASTSRAPVEKEPLPAALEQLLAHLAASSSSNPDCLTHLPMDLDDDRYGSFFRKPRGREAVDTGDERRWKVRLQLLTAIGKCPTLRSIWMWGRYEIGVHRVEEVEALLGGLSASDAVLEQLLLWDCKGLVSEASCRGPLGRLLRHTRTLQELNLRGTGVKAAGLRHLVEALLANPDPALQKLDVSWNEVGDANGGTHVAALLRDNALPTLRFLNIQNIDLNVDGALRISRALAKNSTLEELQLGYEWNGKAVAVVLQVGLGETDTVDNRGSNRSIKKLVLNLFNDFYDDCGYRITYLDGVNAALRTNHVLETLQLDSVKVDIDSEKASLEALLEIAQGSIRSLSLVGLDSSRAFKKAVFLALRSNTKLQVLDMSRWNALDDQLFKDLMDSLESNTTLHDIHMDSTSWAREGKDAFVRQVLRRNAGQVAYLPSLRNAGLRFVPPNMARLFLCGPATAGKTTLRRSMVRCHKKIWERIMSVYKRTKAIEVELLTDEANMQVAIWDLAGQDEFRILHDHLFPDIRQACMFLFVFNPLDVQKSTFKAKEFQDDLTYWLRFLSSNGRSGGNDVKMQLLVVITHLDEMGGYEKSILDWVVPIVDILRKEFEELVTVCKPIFVVDAKSSEDAKPVVSKVFECLTFLCSEKLPLVPEACTRMSVALTKWVSRNPSKPFMSEDLFEHLCEAELKDYSAFDFDEITNAISSYLHDVGSILYFKDIRLRVVNINWVTHVFLGSLIQSEKPILSSIVEGFMTRQELIEVLNVRFVRNHKRFLKSGKKQKYSGYDVQNLLNIMIHLELCYEAPLHGESAPGFFIPATIHYKDAKAMTGLRQLEWPSLDHGGTKFDFVGCRLQCQDQRRTLLTPAFYPRFQVHLRNHLFSEEESLGMLPHQYKYGCNLISIVHNGMDILIESSGGGQIGDYIDILVKSTKWRRNTNAFIKEHVLDKLKDFCASPKGCPGVALVESIINPYCVAHLTLCAHRQEQAVLKTELRARLLHEKLQESCKVYFVDSDTLDFVHHWPPIVGVGGICNNKVEELLDTEELAEIVDRNKQFFESRRTSIEEVASKLVPANSTHPIRRPPMPIYRATSDLSDNPLGQFRYTVTGALDNVIGALARIEDNQKQAMEAIRAVEKIIISSQQETLRSLESKMDTILGMSLEFQESRMPKRPFISTDGASFRERFMATVYVGKPVRLHLMCEDKAGNHIVVGQPGYSMIVEKSNCERIRDISVNGAKLLFFLAKAGLHVAAGLGKAIPDFAQWGAGGSVIVAGLGLAEQTITQLPDQTTVEDANVEDVWMLLEQRLRPLLKDRMVELFQLYEVLIEGKVAWLCQNCKRKYDRGRRIQ